MDNKKTKLFNYLRLHSLRGRLSENYSVANILNI